MTDRKILRDIQLSVLSMLREFDEICRRNNIRYFAIGGTLLGAVRHQGFIPWDDDIDLMMPRKDFETLKAVSPYDCGVDVQPEDQLLLLVTCIGNDTERRVVAARRIREGETEEELLKQINGSAAGNMV